MIDPINKLTVLIDNVGVVTNHSADAADFLRDKFTLSIDPSTDYLYIGFYKPFGTVFAEISTGNVSEDKLELQYFNGSVWVDLDTCDETNGLNRSGFVFWDKECMTETTINGISKYYVRAKTSNITTEVEFNGLNILFSDDASLQQEDSTVLQECLYTAGYSSHIMSHVASRNHIIQLLRNLGYVTTNAQDETKNVTAFDLMDVFEVRQAATYLALSKIYLKMADDQESIEWLKYMEYKLKFEESFRLARLTLDTNNNGLSDDTPVQTSKSFVWSR